MESKLKQLLLDAVQEQLSEHQLDANAINWGLDDINIQTTKNPQFGDLASNVALKLQKRLQLDARLLAQQLVNRLPSVDWLQKCEVAGPGFINFYLTKQHHYAIIEELISAEQESSTTAGVSTDASKGRVYLEFVSANPTGPLHVGHGRSAAFGDSLQRIFKAAGYETFSEYYVNDAGRQIDILSLSVWLRYLQQTQPSLPFPSNAYQGDYIMSMVNACAIFVDEQASVDIQPFNYQYLQQQNATLHDPEKLLDELIQRCKCHFADNYKPYKNKVVQHILDDIQNDLAEFGVHYDSWFFEHSLFDKQQVDKTIQQLKQLGTTYEQDQALWFRASQFGDDKDRVLIRSDGQKTYFSSDISYHHHKLTQGYDLVINIFGADHHGYIKRLEVAMQALLGSQAQALQFRIVQFATLFRGEQKVPMTTRGGKFVSLRHMRDEIGNDAARFFYTMTKPDQHMNFDLELAISKSNDNPVFYVQYAHARISSLFERADERGQTWQHQVCEPYLKDETELELMKLLAQFEQRVDQAATQLAPHLINQYLRHLAAAVHHYYNHVTILATEPSVRNARLSLLKCCQLILAKGLNLLGVSAPKRM